MPLIAWIITLIFTIENALPYLIGYWLTPKDAVFLGTVHHPSDYFYYVSQFAQSGARWLTTVDLYTSELIKPTFVGWSNVALGHLPASLGASPILSYQIWVVICTILLFLSAYIFSKEALGNKRVATISLYLFGLYHAFPILRDGKQSYGDYFNNFAVPRVRFGGVPHQLLMATASIYLAYLIIRWSKTHNDHVIKRVAPLITSSIILASLQPVLWAIVIGVFSIIAGLYILSKREKHKILSTFIFPIFIAGIFGIFPVFYLSNLFTTPPFLQLRLWEATQQTALTLGHFTSATGPIFFIALFSLPWFIRKMTHPQAFISLFAIMSFAIFLSPLPIALTLTHVRFMSTLTILCLAIIAAVGIDTCANFCFAHVRKTLSFTRTPHPLLFTCIILAALTLYLLPNHLLTIRLASEFSPMNAYHYLARSDYEFLQKSTRTSNANDSFLVIWPYNVIFPALTGKRSFHGHTLLTINSTQKDAQAVRFFDNKMTDTEAQSFLLANHITYVIAYSWTKFPKDLMIHKATGGSLSLYEINRDYLKPYSK